MGRFFYYRYRHVVFTLWLTIAFFKRRRCVPKHIYLAAYFRIAGSKGIRFFTRGRWHSRSPVAVYFVGNRVDRPLFETLSRVKRHL